MNLGPSICLLLLVQPILLSVGADRVKFRNLSELRRRMRRAQLEYHTNGFPECSTLNEKEQGRILRRVQLIGAIWDLAFGLVLRILQWRIICEIWTKWNYGTCILRKGRVKMRSLLRIIPFRQDLWSLLRNKSTGRFLALRETMSFVVGIVEWLDTGQQSVAWGVHGLETLAGSSFVKAATLDVLYAQDILIILAVTALIERPNLGLQPLTAGTVE
uniref:Putative effector protein n=1 Tax=Heterodera avenae TaxID=34510 RepID=A0A2L0VDK9_HETAV|nr:putative effector protein [Heterodera avenae]